VRTGGWTKEISVSDFRAKWLYGLAMTTVLYLMYSPVFVTDYLMNDERVFVGAPLGLRWRAKHLFFMYGRALFGIYSTLVYRFAGYDLVRIQLVRFVNFISLAAIAFLLFLFLQRISENAWFSSLVILFLFSLPPFQSAMAFSLQLISNSQPAMWFSLLAFYVYFYARRLRLGKPLRLLFVFVLLILAMQSTQTYAFFAMVPLAYLVLTDWKNQRRKVAEFLAVALVVLVISTLVYKVGLAYWHRHGMQGYVLGEQAMAAVSDHPIRMALHAVNPFAYWSAFEIWSYPFPFQSVPPLGTAKVVMACVLLSAWALLLIWTFLTEVQQCLPWERREIYLKWLAVLACLAFGAVFVAADSPLVTIEHRPHLFTTFIGVAVLSAAYCLQVLVSRYPRLGKGFPKVAGVVFVAMTAFGAQAAILRAYVNNRMEELDFIRTELMARHDDQFRKIIVVLPGWTGCLTEPCGPWEGHVTEDLWHLSRPEGYRYALATVGIPPAGKIITVVSKMPKEIPRDSIVIDWQKYALARKREAKFLRQHRLF
jgi:hypothetical protein